MRGGLSTLGKRILFRLKVAVYFWNRVKSLYLFLGIIILGLVLIALTVLPAYAPFKLTELQTIKQPAGDPSEQWKFFYNYSRSYVSGDSLYVVNRKLNTLDVYSLDTVKSLPKRRIAFGDVEICASMNATGDFHHPLFYAYQDKDSLRHEYAFDPIEKRFHSLLEYPYRKPSANLDGEGVAINGHLHPIHKGIIYYLATYYGFNTDPPLRGLWSLNLNTGKRKHILPTAAFPDFLHVISVKGRNILIAGFGAVSNGASYRGMNDSNGYILAWDLDTGKEIWRKKLPMMCSVRQLFTADYGTGLYQGRLIFTFYHFSDYSPERTWVLELEPETGKEIAKHQGLDVPGKTSDLMKLFEKSQTIRFWRPSHLFEMGPKKLYREKDWEENSFMYGQPYTVFRFRNRIFTIAYEQNTQTEIYHLLDTHGDEYLSIPRKRYFPGDADDKQFDGELRVFHHEGKYYLKIAYISYAHAVDRIYRLEPRNGFKYISSIYRHTDILKRHPGRSINLMFLIMLITGITGMMILNRHYHTFKQLASFFTSPEMVFKSSAEISEKLKAQVRECTILVARIIGLNDLIASQPSIKDQSTMMGRIMKCLANTCFCDNVVIDKYLNDGILLLIEGSNRKDTIMEAIRLSRVIQKEISDLSTRLGLPYKLKMVFGVSHGENLVGLFGTETKKDFTCVGKYVNLAFRLAYATNHPGLITHSEAVEGLELELRPIRLQIKGFEEQQDYLVVKNVF